ncbi:hypothetical protein GCM10010393_57860 [Streptomyces gobitricini]|uniref:Uncharacterized protein n=1 Tax=Streptomyces gobitricini TaxID=68211 RepID=A0ABN3NAC3_9ACTN
MVCLPPGEALHGALGADPRKGASHTWQDLEKEPCHVSVTIMVALTTLSPLGEKPLCGAVPRRVPTGTRPVRGMGRCGRTSENEGGCDHRLGRSEQYPRSKAV